MAPKTATSRSLLLPLAFTLVFGGCRSVIGIEDLSLDAASASDGTTVGDASLDTSFEATVDAQVDAAPPPSLTECATRCRADAGNSVASNFFDQMHNCICNGGSPKVCQSECSNFCPNNNANATCEACILQQTFLDGGACVSRLTTCNATCKTFGDCIKACQ